METFSALLSLSEGNSPATGEFPSQSPVTQSFDVFYDLHLNKRLSKRSRRRWSETPSCSLWCHCNVIRITYLLLFPCKLCVMRKGISWGSPSCSDTFKARAILARLHLSIECYIGIAACRQGLRLVLSIYQLNRLLMDLCLASVFLNIAIHGINIKTLSYGQFMGRFFLI